MLTASTDLTVPPVEVAVTVILSSAIIELAKPSHNVDRYGPNSIRSVHPDVRNWCCTVAIDITRLCTSCKWERASSDCTLRAFSNNRLATICRLLATRG